MSENTPGTTNEVAPPSARIPEQHEFSDQSAPAFVMSAEGQALRQQLDAAAGKSTTVETAPKPEGITQLPLHEQLRRHNEAKAIEKPIAKGADGDEPTAEDRTTPGDYELAVDYEILPTDLHEDAKQFAVDVSAIAEQNGLSVDVAQAAFSAASSLFMNERDLEITNADQAVTVMHTRYGTEKGNEIIRSAQAQAQALGPDFLRWCDETGAGSSPAVLMVLSMLKSGDLSLSPTAAQAKIKAIRSAPDGGSPYNIARASVLSRIAHPSRRDRDASGYAPRDAGTLTSTIAPMIPAGSIRDRLAAINADPDLLSSDAVKRTKLVDERAQLQAAIATKQRGN